MSGFFKSWPTFISWVGLYRSMKVRFFQVMADLCIRGSGYAGQWRLGLGRINMLDKILPPLGITHTIWIRIQRLMLMLEEGKAYQKGKWHYWMQEKCYLGCWAWMVPKIRALILKPRWSMGLCQNQTLGAQITLVILRMVLLLRFGHFKERKKSQM